MKICNNCMKVLLLFMCSFQCQHLHIKPTQGQSISRDLGVKNYSIHLFINFFSISRTIYCIQSVYEYFLSRCYTLCLFSQLLLSQIYHFFFFITLYGILSLRWHLTHSPRIKSSWCVCCFHHTWIHFYWRTGVDGTQLTSSGNRIPRNRCCFGAQIGGLNILQCVPESSSLVRWPFSLSQLVDS